MQYLIMAYEDPAAFETRTGDGADAYWASWGAYVDALGKSGVLTSAGGLESPHTATSVTLRDGQRLVQDGPYADTKEQLGGFFVVDVPDLDAALEWAARCPSAGYSGVEVRPLIPPR